MKIVALALLLAGCEVTGAFPCTEDDQCRVRGATARCETTAGYCVISDETCSSGERYTSAAGALAETCTAPADAAVATDAAFDVSQCPATFTATVSARPMSRYAFIPGAVGAFELPFPMIAMTCADALPGRTHPAVVSDAALGLALGALIAAESTATYAYVGLLQDPQAVSRSAGWINFDDTVVATAAWGTEQPDDADRTENHSDDFGALARGGTLVDTVGTLGLAMLCECDGTGVGTLAQTYLDTP